MEKKMTKLLITVLLAGICVNSAQAMPMKYKTCDNIKKIKAPPGEGVQYYLDDKYGEDCLVA